MYNLLPERVEKPRPYLGPQFAKGWCPSVW